MGRVLYISQYVVTPDQPGGVRHWRHVRALADAGHKVTVITTKVLHTTREAPGEFAGRRAVRRVEDGIEVIRAYSSTGYSNDAKSRAANHLSFSTYALPAAMRTARPDVVLGSSPPLTVGVLGGVVSQLRRTRFILEVRDLWPESALATGLLTDPKAIAVMDRMARYCYSRADRVIALTEGIRDGVIDAGVAPNAVKLITNGIDPPDTPIDPSVVDLPVGPDVFVAMFVGQHGTYSSLFTVLDAAKRLGGDRRVHIALVGDGDRKPDLIDYAQTLGLDNVSFSGPIPKRDVPSWLARADACLLTYQDAPLFGGAMPNKLFDYMGAGRPILAAIPDGEAARAIRAAGCGIVTPAEDPGALADALVSLADDRAAARTMGAKGVEYVQTNHNRRELAARFVQVVESVLA
jgi:glycosyltransferase involved in cell wall biosynthesis